MIVASEKGSESKEDKPPFAECEPFDYDENCLSCTELYACEYLASHASCPHCTTKGSSRRTNDDDSFEFYCSACEHGYDVPLSVGAIKERKNDVRYFAQVGEKIATGKNTWEVLRVDVFQQRRGEKPERIGSYKRTYPHLFDTFFPFKHANGKWYALYSSDYTATRIMELPSCKDIGGEQGYKDGFCPVEYYVPNCLEGSFEHDGKTVVYHENDVDEQRLWDGKVLDRKWNELKFRPFGFIAGCVWGDDWSYKIEYLDLKDADKGIVRREAKFGYIWLPTTGKLKNSIDVDDYDDLGLVRIACPISFDLEKDYSYYDLYDDAQPIDRPSDEEKAEEREKLKQALGEFYGNWVDFKTILFVLQIRGYKGIIGEAERKMLAEGGKAKYMETLKGVLSAREEREDIEKHN